MSFLCHHVSLRRPPTILGLALVALALAPGVSSAAAEPLDTVTVTNASGSNYLNVNISAQSGTSGQNPTGTASFNVIGLQVSGPVTCLSVTGPDMGGGTFASPTVAVLNVQSSQFGIVTVEVGDLGGGGRDDISSIPTGRAPSDCSPFNPSNGILGFLSRAVVFDAPLVPTSKDQCKSNGWRNFPQFKNQGDCVSFVENGK
jgi:hypothetical protein